MPLATGEAYVSAVSRLLSDSEPAPLRKPGPERRAETRGARPRAGQKQGGQALLGGLDCLVQRNFFGAQIDSFEAELPAPAALRPLPAGGAAGPAPGADSFRALFIRAPAVLEAGASVEVLAEYRCARAGCRQALLSVRRPGGRVFWRRGRA